MRRIFVGEAGLRAGWRLLLFHAIALVVAVPVAQVLVRILRADETAGPTLGQLIAMEALYISATLVALFAMSRIERRSWRSYSIPPPRELFGGSFGIGALAGAGALLGIALLVLVSGGARIEGIDAGTSVLLAGLGWLFATLLIALFEELFFRGYFLSTLAEGIGFWPAAIAQSLFFGFVLHYLEKDNETLLDGWNVSLVAFLLCWSVRRTGSVAWAVGFHWTFNFASFFLVGSPNTLFGGPVEPHLLRTTFTGPDWLTGGPTGLEASVWTTVVTSVLFALFRSRRTASAAP